MSAGKIKVAFVLLRIWKQTLAMALGLKGRAIETTVEILVDNLNKDGGRFYT